MNKVSIVIVIPAPAAVWRTLCRLLLDDVLTDADDAAIDSVSASLGSDCLRFLVTRPELRDFDFPEELSSMGTLDIS